MISTNDKFRNAGAILRNILLFSLRNACLSFFLMFIIALLASKNIDEETLKSFMAMWDFSLMNNKDIIRPAFFGVVIMNVMQTTLSIMYISFIGKLGFICVKFYKLKNSAYGEYNDFKEW